MSGPKTSRYTLTPEQRRILMEQQEREKRTNEEQIKLKKYIKEINIFKSGLIEPLECAEELQKRDGSASEYIAKVSDIKKEIQEVLNKNCEISKEIGLERLEIQRKAVEACLKNAKKQMNLLKAETVKIQADLHQNINKNIDKGFSIDFTDVFQAPKNNAFDELYKNIIDSLNLLTEDADLPDFLLHEINAAKSKIAEIKSIEFLENYKVITIIPLQKKCRQYIADYEARGEHFENLLIRYQALCDALRKEAKTYKFSIDAISEIKLEINKMEKQMLEQYENEYISSCIDDVMVEMGYNLLGQRNVTKRSGKSFQNELYSFDEGTAVNVTYASDGKITMELGGIDTEDRMPKDDETKKLCEDMESFCNDFREIERKLKVKGIIAGERISLLPPSSEYAQIINVEDYDIKAEGCIHKLNVKTRKKNAEKQIYKRNE